MGRKPTPKDPEIPWPMLVGGSFVGLTLFVGLVFALDVGFDISSNIRENGFGNKHVEDGEGYGLLVLLVVAALAVAAMMAVAGKFMTGDD